MRGLFCTTLCILIICVSFWILPPQSQAQVIPEEALELKEEGDRAVMRGDMEEAVRFYDKALRIYPDFPEVLYFLGLTYDLDFEDLVNAIYYYRRYLEVAPNGDQAPEVASRLKDAEIRHEERKRELGLVEEPSKPKPPAKPDSEEMPSKAVSPPPVAPPVPEPEKTSLPSKVISSLETGNIITLQLEDRILKYELKLRVWEREGFVDRFNELARKRISPLEEDIAGQREALRIERKKTTDFINYQDEAIQMFFEKAVFIGIFNLGIELNHYPAGLSPTRYIRSYKVLDLTENDKFIELSIEISIDLEALGNDLFNMGFSFEPIRVAIILQNVRGNLAVSLIEKIISHSDYAGPSSEGLYPIYTTFDIFTQTIRELKIGKYRFNPVSKGENSITIEVLSEKE
ncbi:MAG: tetratricopeptide repeat protein [bacterium]